MLIDPLGRQASSMGCTGSSTFSGGLTLAYSGTYTIGVDPRGTTGSVSINLNGFANVSGTLPVGIPTTIATSIPGQTAKYVFSGTAGQIVDIALTNSTFTSCWYYSISNPDGSTLRGSTITCGTHNVSGKLTLPSAGTYSLRIDPGTGTGGVTATLTQMVTQSLAFNTPLTVNSTLAGQLFNLTFGGNTGQVIDLAFINSTFTACWYYSISNPNGTTLRGSTITCGSHNVSGKLTLPSTGIYSIMIDPAEGTGGVSTTLTQMITQSLAFNTPLTVNSTLAGQLFSLAFSGSLGQVIDLAQTNSTYGCWYYSISNPDGSTLKGSTITCGSSNNSGNLTLPSTGTYSILIDPAEGTGGVTSTLTLIQ